MRARLELWLLILFDALVWASCVKFFRAAW
jgi:hypothetical protein